MGYLGVRRERAAVSGGRDYTTRGQAARHARPPLWKTQPMKRTVWRARSSTSRVKTSGRA